MIAFLVEALAVDKLPMADRAQLEKRKILLVGTSHDNLRMSRSGNIFFCLTSCYAASLSEARKELRSFAMTEWTESKFLTRHHT